ncbi:hypothetical protein WCO46_25415, partial [Escherichia coli]
MKAGGFGGVIHRKRGLQKKNFHQYDKWRTVKKRHQKQRASEMSDLIAYTSNALIEASYKLTLQEQRFQKVFI